MLTRIKTLLLCTVGRKYSTGHNPESVKMPFYNM